MLVSTVPCASEGYHVPLISGLQYDITILCLAWFQENIAAYLDVFQRNGNLLGGHYLPTGIEKRRHEPKSNMDPGLIQVTIAHDT